MTQVANKSSSLDLYRQRLQPVLQFVQTHLIEGLSLTEAASISHFSKFHFQRIFSVVMGESLVAYINRMRLEKAANLILYCPEQAITEIALACGFSGSTAFARAFKKHFGVSAVSIRKYRKRGGGSGESSIKWQPTAALDSHRLRCFYEKVEAQQPVQLPFQDRADINPTIQPIRMQTIAEQHYCTLRSEQGYVLADIFNAWNRLFDWASLHGVAIKQTHVIALCHDNPIFTHSSNCRYDASINITAELVATIKYPFRHTRIPAGEYAVFAYCGTAHDASDFHLSIYHDWLPQSQYEPDDVPSFERYRQPMFDLNIETVNNQDLIRMEVWVKVKALTLAR